jgi:hypothetical protein
MSIKIEISLKAICYLKNLIVMRVNSVTNLLIWMIPLRERKLTCWFKTLKGFHKKQEYSNEKLSHSISHFNIDLFLQL